MTLSNCKTTIITICAIALVLSACATIVGHPTQTIPITSTPSEASIIIVDEAGLEVFKGKSPTSATLQKSTGQYWGKKSYTVTVSMDGYKDQVVHLTASPTGWYIAGNLLFGGIIGWFIVDPYNGNMYTLSPENVAAGIGSADVPKKKAARDGSISVTLLQDVPADLRSKLVRIQ